MEEAKKKQAAETIPADQFNLVCLKQWEDDIIWSSKDYRPKENSEALRSLAGWIPSLNIRTMKAYLQQFANKSKSIFRLISLFKASITLHLSRSESLFKKC